MLLSYRPWFCLSTLLTLCMILSCGSGDDAEAIRTLIREGADRAEAHDIGGIISLTTDDFQAMPGELNRQGVKGILWRTFRYYGELKVLYPKPDVDIREEGREASAAIPFLIVSKDQEIPELSGLYESPLRWLEEAGKIADLYRLELDLLKGDGDWLVRRARLERFKGLGFGE